MKKQQLLYNKSILSTLVLGDNHIINMTHFLTNITKEYTLKVRIESQKYSFKEVGENDQESRNNKIRCISFDNVYLRV